MIKTANVFLLILLFLFAGINHGYSFSQDAWQEKDSIQALIKKSTNDEVKSGLFFTLAKYYQQENSNDSALIFYQRSYQLLNDTLSDDAEKILNELGMFYYRQSDFANALSCFQKAIQITKRNNDTLTIGRRHSNIAVIYDHLGDYVKSIEHNQEALKIFEQQNFKRGMAFIFNNLGVLSEEMERPENALNYHRRALKLKMELNDKLGVGNSLNNIGVVFEQYLPNLDSSIYYYRKAFEAFSEISDKSGIATSLGNIGVIHRRNQQPDSAVLYTKEALKIRTYLNDEEGKSSSLLNLGRAYYDKREYDKAESYFLQSLVISRTIYSRNRTSKIYKSLALLYNQTRENDKAYRYHVKYSQLKDSILNEENAKQIAELETRYELEKKDKQLDELSHKNSLQKQSISRYNYLLSSILLIALLIAFITILLIRHNRLRAQQQTAQLQQKLLRSQMNPHFIFNTLFSIQTYMLENDAISASRFLSKFAKLMRHILENSKHEFVTLENEIEFLNNYLFIQQLRFNESFTYNVIFENEEESSQIYVPPMLSQPFVENAIDHGIRNIDWKGRVEVLFEIDGENLMITIKDNGRGFYHKSEERNMLDNHQSSGIENAKQRVLILTNKYKSDNIFKIVDLSRENPDGKGTIVTFAIPIMYVG